MRFCCRAPLCRASSVPHVKNFISAAELGPDHAKGSDTHKNSVTGDTVEDPLKDILGPALNRVMKLTVILSLVLGSPIADASHSEGGPFWMNLLQCVVCTFLTRLLIACSLLAVCMEVVPLVALSLVQV